MAHQQSQMWVKKQIELINNEIDEPLTSFSDVKGFNNLIREALAGFVLRRGAKPWYLLPLVACESISGGFEHAVPASASFQLFMTAAEIFDDIEDADTPGALSAKYGSSLANNIATTFLLLAEGAIVRLKGRGVADATIVSIMETINGFFVNACGGQHLDLSLTRDTTVSEDTYLIITYRKSASIVECACKVGALLATTNQELIDLCALFGQNLGMASQIANDLQGITSGRDIIKQKVTLPVIYALANTESETRRQLELFFINRCENTPGITQIRDLLFQSGAVYYTTTKMELYKEHAADNLIDLGKFGANIKRLKSFLE